MIITAVGLSSEIRKNTFWPSTEKKKQPMSLALKFLPFWGCPSRRRAAQEPLRQRSGEAEPSCPKGECCPGREVQETGISLC